MIDINLIDSREKAVAYSAAAAAPTRMKADIDILADKYDLSRDVAMKLYLILARVYGCASLGHHNTCIMWRDICSVEHGVQMNEIQLEDTTTNVPTQMTRIWRLLNEMGFIVYDYRTDANGDQIRPARTITHEAEGFYVVWSVDAFEKSIEQFARKES